MPAHGLLPAEAVDLVTKGQAEAGVFDSTTANPGGGLQQVAGIPLLLPAPIGGQAGLGRKGQGRAGLALRRGPSFALAQAGSTACMHAPCVHAPRMHACTTWWRPLLRLPTWYQHTQHTLVALPPFQASLSRRETPSWLTSEGACRRALAL